MSWDPNMVGRDFYCAECKTIRAKLAIWLPGERLPRCGIDGHRMVYQDTVPLATRYSPPWKWPRELINRHHARRIGTRRIFN